MSDMAVSRRLVAVFAADVEGYSRLMGTDEVGTLKGLTERRAILDRFIGEHRGRIANTAGDSVLVSLLPLWQRSGPRLRAPGGPLQWLKGTGCGIRGEDQTSPLCCQTE